MRKNLSFRAWYYFRMGWGNYLTFILSAVNTMTVTYYLAVENLPQLKLIFPSFLQYVFIATSVGVPLMIFAGYVHYKKSTAYKAESDIIFESNPHLKRMFQNTEAILPLYLQISQIILKISKNEKPTEKEIEEISKIQNQLSEHIDKRLSGKYESTIYDDK